MEQKGLIRPRICPDLQCELLWSDFLPSALEQGYSFSCIGRLDKPHEFVWREVVHRNDFCFCQYTPLKGMIKFLMNKEDIEHEIAVLGVALRAIKMEQCAGCGGEGPYFHTVGAKSYCPMCALRIGLFNWDAESRIYVWSHEKYLELEKQTI
jgi:hypothetical protein